MRAVRGYLLPAALVLVAVVLALLAADLRAEEDALASGDARYASTPGRAEWRASSVLPAGAARRLLATEDDVAAREALRGFRATAFRRGRLDNAVQVAADRADAEVALGEVARSDDVDKASQALTLLGVLAFSDFARSGRNSAGLADAAVSAFDAAVRLDPDNEAAKYDLELALEALQARGVRIEPGSGSGIGSTGRRGGGGGTPGNGY